MKMRQVFYSMALLAMVGFANTVLARPYVDPVISGTELGMFPNLRETCVTNDAGECETDKKGNTKMRKITDAEVKEQVRKKLAPYLRLRKIGKIEISENEVMVNIVEPGGAHFYTMRVDRDKALSEREKPFVEKRNARKAVLNDAISHAISSIKHNKNSTLTTQETATPEKSQKKTTAKTDKKNTTKKGKKKFKTFW